MPNLNWSLVTLSFLIESSLRRACLSTAWLNAAVRMAFEADAIRNDIAVPHPQAALNFSAAATAHRHPALAGNRLSHMQSAIDAEFQLCAFPMHQPEFAGWTRQGPFNRVIEAPARTAIAAIVFLKVDLNRVANGRRTEQAPAVADPGGFQRNPAG